MTVAQMDQVTRAAYERELDFALAASFPASDPLPWTLGYPAEPAGMPADRWPKPPASASEVMVDPRAWGGYGGLVGVAEAIALAALVPIGILAIGLPLVAAIRAVATVVLRLAV